MTTRREQRYILNGKRPEACGSLLRWGAWMQTADRRVARNRVGDFVVSTVFLGLDHGWNSKVPILFETMVFCEDDGGGGDRMQRYATWEEAEAGHARIAAEVRAQIKRSSDDAANVLERVKEAMAKRP